MLENYSVEAWLKSLKIAKSWFYSANFFLGIKYMFQQRTVQKISEDNHYKYARELAIQYRNSTLFTTTDHKNKIKCMSLVVLFQL